ALKIRQAKLPANHFDISISLNDLGNVYVRQKNYDQAEPLLTRCLEIVEKTHGADSPHVATALANLAHVYTGRKEYAKAEPLWRRYLRIREETNGADHASLEPGLRNLG